MKKHIKQDNIVYFYRGATNREADGSLIISYMREKNFLVVDEFFCTAKSKNKLINADLAVTTIIRLFENLFSSHSDERIPKILQEFIKNLEALKNESISEKYS